MKKEKIVSIYKEKAKDGRKSPSLQSIHRHAKKHGGGQLQQKSVKKILDKERLIYRHRGNIVNPCQVNVSDSIKKEKD